MKRIKVISWVIVGIFIGSMSPAVSGDYWTTYNKKVRYHYRMNYMLHRKRIQHYNRIVKKWRGKGYRYYPTLSFSLGWNRLPSNKELNRRIKLFRSLPMYIRKPPFELGERNKIGRAFTIKYNSLDKGKESSYQYPKIAWFDTPPKGYGGIGDIWGLIDINESGGTKKWITWIDWSLAHPDKYPMKYRVWGGKKKVDSIRYLGIIDDDLMYDFRKEDPFGRGDKQNLLTTNASGPFIYVYSFDTLRRRSYDWEVHDRLAYGYRDDFKEDNHSPSEKHYYRRDTDNKARLEYGPIISSINRPILRALRVRIHQRMYLAKLRLAKLCHPAPGWRGVYADSQGRYYGEKKIRERRVNIWKIIKKYADTDKYPDFDKARELLFKEISKVPVYDYWHYIMNKIYPPDPAYKAYDKWLNWEESQSEYLYSREHSREGSREGNKWENGKESAATGTGLSSTKIGKGEQRELCSSPLYPFTVVSKNTISSLKGQVARICGLSLKPTSVRLSKEGVCLEENKQKYGRETTVYERTPHSMSLNGSHTSSTSKVGPELARATGLQGIQRQYGRNSSSGTSPNDLLRRVKREVRLYNLCEAVRDMYWYQAMRTPTKIDRERDFQRYFNRDYLSIAIWSGCTGYGRRRHECEVSPKTIYPYYEGDTKPGLHGFIRGGKARDMNTGGLLHGGFVDNPRVLRRLLAYYGKLSKEDIRLGRWGEGDMEKLWKAAMKGPFMIVSDRTYKKYGHKYFEKLAGHPLVKADVTGAITDCNARVILDPDPECVSQLMDMDYFYVKNNKKQVIGTKRMKPANKIKISSWAIKDAKKYRKKYYPTTEFNIRSTKPFQFRNKPRMEYDFDDYVDGIYATEGIRLHSRQLVRLHKEIYRAYRKDQRHYPDMSLLRAHYLRNLYMKHNEPLAGYAFIGKMEELRTLINEHKNNHRALQKHVLNKHFHFFLGNPNVFLAIFKNLRVYKTIAHCYHAKDRGLYNRHQDGVFMYGHRGGEFSIPEQSLRRFRDIANTRKDQWLDSYLYSKVISNGTALRELASRGRLRKRLAKEQKIYFPKLDTMLQYMCNRKFYRSTAYSEIYINMRNNNGKPTGLRALHMISNSKGGTRGTVARSIYRLFPGMYRYIPAHLVDMWQQYYREYYFKQRRNEFTCQNDILVPIYPYSYEPATMTYTWIIQDKKDKNDVYNGNGPKDIALNVSATMCGTYKRSRMFPTDNLEFIVASGIPTTLMMRKDKRIDVWTRANSKLYAGVEVVK